MKRSIAAVADDNFIESIHPININVISSIGEASQIKTSCLHVPRMPSRVNGARCLDPATRNACVSRINSETVNHRGRRGWRRRRRLRSKCRRLEIVAPS
jgi:hypothetical protein